ncbi:hypothetical protein [Rhizobium sp. MHM7A]|uniref:hypothetical protein n=1 Tax=Rhizobium sp. MHM7A TaxID=2583233 RepID=UPI0011075076|nr:hypothetical protein [Rhizobium sp. MHM7A]TLX17078.1 hypothetical protein FFR93_07125 [Rhizobium sp. MHM7A]
MAIDLFIPEFLFFTPRWEPSDCSVVDHPRSGRLQIFCHMSQRLVALVDTVDEADILMIRVGLRIRRFPATPYKDDDFMKSWFAPAIKSLLQSLEKRGLKDDDLAPEIVGRNASVQNSSAAATVKRLIDGRSSISIALNDLSITESANEGGAPIASVSVSRDEVDDVVSTLFSDLMVDDGSADIELSPGEVADLDLLLGDDDKPITLRITRTRPDYPGYI